MIVEKTKRSGTQWSLADEDMEVSCDNPAHSGGRMIFACCRGAFASAAKLTEWDEEQRVKNQARQNIEEYAAACDVDAAVMTRALQFDPEARKQFAGWKAANKAA